MRTLCALFLCLAPLPAQIPCPDQGSESRAALIETGPALGCAHAPEWPAWHMFTFGHRAPVPKPGFHLGEAHELPRLFVTWRCTGLLLLPAVPDRLRTMGYVVDVGEVPCWANGP